MPFTILLYVLFIKCIALKIINPNYFKINYYLYDFKYANYLHIKY